MHTVIVSTFALLAASAIGLRPPLAEWVAIRQVLNTYPLAIDSKDFALLGNVFTEDVVADYGPGIGVLHGLSAVEEGLAQDLAKVDTQHALSTTVIDVRNGTANSTTYYTASHFGQGAYEGAVLYAYGKYLDDFVKVFDGYGHGVEDMWRIQNRTLVYMGPFIGNLSIFS